MKRKFKSIEDIDKFIEKINLKDFYKELEDFEGHDQDYWKFHNDLIEDIHEFANSSLIKGKGKFKSFNDVSDFASNISSKLFDKRRQLYDEYLNEFKSNVKKDEETILYYSYEDLKNTNSQWQKKSQKLFKIAPVSSEKDISTYHDEAKILQNFINSFKKNQFNGIYISTYHDEVEEMVEGGIFHKAYMKSLENFINSFTKYIKMKYGEKYGNQRSCQRGKFFKELHNKGLSEECYKFLKLLNKYRNSTTHDFYEHNDNHKYMDARSEKRLKETHEAVKIFENDFEKIKKKIDDFLNPSAD